ncbi:MAG: M48 family metallopeptidase [Deferrisomatales bacterium]
MRCALLTAFVLTCLARLGLHALNLRHLRRHGHEVPPGFEEAVDPVRLRRAAAYAADRERAAALESAVTSALAAVFLFGGWLGRYDRWVASLAPSFVGGGVCFVLGLHLLGTLADLPFRLHRTFRLEARYGFHTSTVGLWIADQVKAELLALALLAGAAGGALHLVAWSPQRWWLWVWGFLAAASVLLIYLAPVAIAPLFFRFEPVADPRLAAAIRELAGRAGIRVDRVLQVDASRRSRHANAYFTGIGRVKRIVLFDTLLAGTPAEEVLAVLAHEMGHWKRGHVRQRIFWAQAATLAALYAASRWIDSPGLPGWLGLESASFPARAAILALAASVAAFPLTPLWSAWSRRQERAADRFAARLAGTPEPLAAALVRLSAENLANLHPHPLYAWFHYSHPPPAERVAYLRRALPGGSR